ncbi:hypothetical protein POM88_042640 [Heracleum sosnowskyi]|uniref:Uncharacterized protein n=1 Tax=Heracleum sosnowskyi TaxID=360622 RepID=A0AAD8HIU6_9APIA|nr:hypothetical protein POM88_042640 [Heracleum sosnowskyi]
MKESVKHEILNLDWNTKETLHEIWQNCVGDSEDLRELDREFWAYQKVVHCWDWDLLKCPQGHYFYMVAKMGKYVRNILLNNEVQADDDKVYDPDAIEIPFLHSLGFMIAEDPTQVFGSNFMTTQAA